MRKSVMAVVAALAAVAVGFGGFLVSDILGVGGGSRRVDIKVSEGETTASIISQLKNSGMISSKTAFKIYTKVTGEHIFRAGIHSLDSSMSYREILNEFESISKHNASTFTVPEGYELRQIADLLEKEGFVNREIFMSEAERGSFDYEFVKAIPNRENRLEGYLFPDTYTVEAGMTEHEIIDMMLKNFANKILHVYNEAASQRSLDETVILASVIEREAAGDEDRGKVASVFVNRLNKGMKLESCATVQYILKERKSVLSNADTQIDSPYNTYKNNGLPVGPIASPGVESVKAALYPENTNYMYFMASADGSGTIFSETFEQQLENQKQIQGGQ